MPTNQLRSGIGGDAFAVSAHAPRVADRGGSCAMNSLWPCRRSAFSVSVRKTGLSRLSVIEPRAPTPSRSGGTARTSPSSAPCRGSAPGSGSVSRLWASRLDAMVAYPPPSDGTRRARGRLIRRPDRAASPDFGLKLHNFKNILKEMQCVTLESLHWSMRCLFNPRVTGKCPNPFPPAFAPCAQRSGGGPCKRPR